MVFSVLSVPFRLLGGRPSSLLVGSLALAAGGAALSVWFAGRAAGPGGALPVAIGLMLLVIRLGTTVISP